MPDYGIEFAELGACVEFLDLGLRNLELLNLSRDHFNQIGITSTGAGRTKKGEGEKLSFTVVLHDVDEPTFDMLRKLARVPGAEARSDSPGRDCCTINELLQRVRLAPQTAMPMDTGLALLLFDADDDGFRQRYTQLLDMGCQDIRVGLVQKTPENYSLTHVITVGQPGKGFWPPAEWGQQAGSHGRALAFYRLRGDDDCKLYVEWGFEFPVDRIERLYDFDHPPCRSIFLCAAPPSRNRAFVDPAEMEQQPLWLRLLKKDLNSIFVEPDRALRLEPSRAAAAVDLQPVTEPAAALLELYVQRDARATNTSMESLEAEIAVHQKAIEDLQRDYHTAHTLRREPVYLAYVFEQQMNQENRAAPELNPTFLRFLDQPYSQSQHYRYGFYEAEHPDGSVRAIHVVISTRPSPYTDVWTSLANEIYVQRSRWHDWGLPLFVRDGDDLRPRLEEKSLEGVFRKLLWDNTDHLHPYDQPIFLRAQPRAERNGDNQLWEAIYLRDTMPLTDPGCFRFLNDRFAASLLEFRADVPPELEARLEDSQVRLTANCEELEQQIIEAIANRIDHAEQEWQKVDPAIEEVRRRVQQHAESVTRIQGAITSLPSDWFEFVERVLTSNRDLVNPQVTALNEYRAAQHDLTEQLDAYQAGILNVEKQVKEDLARVATRREQLAALIQSLNTLLNQLSNASKDLHRKQEEALGRVRTLREQADKQLSVESQRLADSRRELNELRGQLEALKLERRRIAGEQTEISRVRNDIARETQQISAEQQRLEADQRAIDQQRSELSGKKADLERSRQKYSQELTAVTAQIAAENQAIQDLKAKFEAKRSELQTALEQTKKRRDAMRALHDETAALAARFQKYPEPDPNQLVPTEIRVRGQVAKEILQEVRAVLTGGGRQKR